MSSMKKVLGLLSTTFLLSSCTIHGLVNNLKPGTNSSNSISVSSGVVSENKEDYVNPNFYDKYEKNMDFSEVSSRLNEEEMLLFNYFTSQNKQTEDNDMSGKYIGKNFIAILAESFEIRFANPYLTPNLYRIINSSYYFDNYFVDEIQSGATCNSEFMSMTSLLPTSATSFRYTVCTKYSNNKFMFALPAQLRANDYDTYYFHSGFKNFYYRNELIPNYGFEVAKFGDDLYEDYEDYMSDEEMIKFFEKYVDADKKFFVNMLTYSMHGAYNDFLTDEEIENVDVNVRKHLKDLGMDEELVLEYEIPSDIYSYLNKMTKFDRLLGKLFSYLEEHQILDDTIIAIYRDHHPYMITPEDYTGFMNVNYDPMFYDESYERFRHPLVIYDSSLNQTVHIDNPGTTLDLAPTFLNMFASDAHYNHFFGNDLFGGESYIFMTAQGYTDTNTLATDGLVDENGELANVAELIEGYKGEDSKKAVISAYLKTKNDEYNLSSYMFPYNYFQWY